MSRAALLGPTGIGTSAARMPVRPARGERVTVPPLYGPGAVRDNEPLARVLDERLAAWFLELGIFTDELDRLRHQSYGRLIMLTHPDSDDPDQLMLAARWAVALWAADDLFTDDEAAGAVPELVPRRLLLGLAAIDQAQLLGRYAGELTEALDGSPVLVALRSSVDWLARHATPAQLNRCRHEVAGMFVSWNTQAEWRKSARSPSVCEYLLARHFDNFVPCMAVIDVVGGYELPATLYADARVRRATSLAGNAAVVANDLYSLTKDELPQQGDVSLPVLVAAEDGCSLQEAVDISVAYHDDLVHAFEAAHRELALVPSPELHRYLLGLRAWIGGSDEWHRSSGRYRIDGGP